MAPDRPGKVAGVVLAAGTSTRFGSNKLLLELDGESLARRAAKMALDAGLDPVIFVLGHEAERIRKELSNLPVRAVLNATYARGMNTSLAAGVAAVLGEAVALVVLLADMPHVSADMISRLVETFRGSGAPLVASNYGGVRAPPTLYARPLFPELGGPEGDGCGRRLARRHQDEVVNIPWPAAALADVDRPEDWERTCAVPTSTQDEGAAPSLGYASSRKSAKPRGFPQEQASVYPARQRLRASDSSAN